MLAILCTATATTPSNPAVVASKDVPVFFISINGSERLRRFRSTFSSFAHVQHVPAVTNATTADYMVHFDQYRRLLTRNTPSELGCALSHVSAIAAAERHCARRGCAMAIVVEDDASDDLLPHWTRSLPEIAAALPLNWAVLQLQLIAEAKEWDRLEAGWRAAPPPAPAAALHDRRLHFGTGAYLIHRRGMAQILKPFTIPPQPPGAAAMVAAMQGRLPAPDDGLVGGALRVPLSAEELQADVALVYRLAGPVLVATPPLLRCDEVTLGAVSTIDHFSATRLKVRFPTRNSVTQNCKWEIPRNYLTPAPSLRRAGAGCRRAQRPVPRHLGRASAQMGQGSRRRRRHQAAAAAAARRPAAHRLGPLVLLPNPSRHRLRRKSGGAAARAARVARR